MEFITVALSYADNWPFLPYTVAWALLASLLVLETLAIFISGSPLMSWVDNLVTWDVDNPSLIADFLFGKDIPFIITLTTFLFGFAFTGTIGSYFQVITPGRVAPLWVLVVFLSSMLVGGILCAKTRRFLVSSKLIHTTAVSSSSFPGNMAIVLDPYIEKGERGMAKYVDGHNVPHYLMVQSVDGSPLKKGDLVLIESRFGEAFWYVSRQDVKG